MIRLFDQLTRSWMEILEVNCGPESTDFSTFSRNILPRLSPHVPELVVGALAWFVFWSVTTTFGSSGFVVKGWSILTEFSFGRPGFEVGINIALPPAITWPTFGTIDFTLFWLVLLLVVLLSFVDGWWPLFACTMEGLMIFITEPANLQVQK